MKRIISLSIMMLCVLFLSAQTAPKERWVNIKLKNQDLISYKVGDVDSIYFTAKDTVKVEDTLSVDLGLSSKLLWAKKDTKNGTVSTFSYRPKDYTAAIAEQFGDDWRIATQADFKELEEACTWEATDDGFVGTSKSNGATILLPYTAEDYCLYWDSENQRTYIYISFDRRKGVIFDTQNDSDPEDFKTCAKSVRAVRTKIDNSGSGEDDPSYTGKYKRPEVIDLGLSVKWGSFNLGAESVTDFGGYFGWGDIKDSLTVSDPSYKYSYELYNTGIAGNEKYDIVAKELGGHWRMPTYNEMKELLDYCSRENVHGDNGNYCVLKSSRNGNQLVLPLAGGKNMSKPNGFDVGQYAYLWTDSATSHTAAMYSLVNGDRQQIGPQERNVHLSIRPVYDDSDNSGSGSGTEPQDPYAGDKTWAVVEGSESNSQTGIIPQAAVNMGTEKKWARWNLGATSRTGVNSVGRYYSWGETTEKDTYSSNTYSNDLPSAGENFFYYLGAESDAATQVWGEAWSLPTAGDIVELIDKCSASRGGSIEWKESTDKMDNGTSYGVNGVLFTSGVTKNSIFFPCGGYKKDTSTNGYGNEIRYWTSEVYNLGTANQQKSWATDLEYYYGDSVEMTKGIWRYYGLLIRPVMK